MWSRCGLNRFQINENTARMHRYFLLCASLMVATFLSGTQEVLAQVPVDTSYTVYSTYRKLIGKYPFIRVVKPQATDAVQVQRDVPYVTVPSMAGTRALKADVYFPTTHEHQHTAVILVHGGGWRSGNKSMNEPLALQLAKQGYVAMSIEYQLSGEAPYPAALHNVKAAVRWLRAQASTFQIDPASIGLIGASAGGQLVSLAGASNNNPAYEGSQGDTTQSSAVQFVIDLDGLLDFTDPETLAVQRTANNADVAWLQGTFDQQPERWRQASAVYAVSTESAPMLFINSSQTRFHAGCNTMQTRLAATGIPFEVVTLENAPHSYWFFEPWFTPMTQYILDYLSKCSSDKK